ncbi:hypothetical protein [Amycolatopsis taiwanensis]|uniref:Uncharacterized protein n=1 Tax=Amycolatopsis taiwanensis TaxID=342230 RepID=A0A9W6VG15_9PSEU|nr:hypothetical protein [Amycolatopsis taiwanensis]GLY70253.1 hypothetical protein Atai01_68720 [Amycolatopsis taiwanensis]
MPALITDVEEIVVRGDLDAVTGFSGNQVEEERRKQRFLEANPELEDALFRLEDHPLLRGTLSAFELDSASFRHRAEAFETAFNNAGRWRELTGALLATGDYQRQRPKSHAWQFGTSSAGQDGVWRYLLAETTFDALSATRTVLGEFLDGLAASGSDPAEHFETVISGWLAERETAELFDWRYYLVKYSSMRSGATGIYYGVDGELGYSMCMLRTQQRNEKYRDPILLEVWESSEAGDRVRDPWFTGYETNPRWLRLERSGVGMRSVSDGFELEGAEDEALQAKFADICNRHNDVDAVGDRTVLKVPQRDHGAGPVDSTDRVVIGAAFLRELVTAGL